MPLFLLRLQPNPLSSRRFHVVPIGPTISRWAPKNFREYLVGLDESPDYFFDQNSEMEATQAIGDWWMDRWLSMRVQKDWVLERVEKHTLIRPITHGARVKPPRWTLNLRCYSIRMNREAADALTSLATARSQSLHVALELLKGFLGDPSL